jgi:outer membrane protein OmpA-like peptidoglycan-associated protein
LTQKSSGWRIKIDNLVEPGGFTVRITCLSDAVRVGIGALGGAVLLLTATGCLATRNWVGEQLQPIKGQQEQLETQVNNLHLERKLVLDSSNGPTFKTGSAALSGNAKREIDAFVGDIQGPAASASAGTTASQRVFVVAGYTDSVGHEDYNYELGQRRATSVAGYLVGNKGLDPTQVRVVSYGASRPVAENSTRDGRRSNRRVEILVYQEKIAS